MTTYTIIKSPRSGYLIDDGSGSSIRYATKGEAERTIAKRQRHEAEAVAYAEEVRAARKDAALAYLAARAARPPCAQLSLFA